MFRNRLGRLPFRGDTSGIVLDGILNRAPTPAVRLNPEVPQELERIIDKAIEKDREIRYQHASDIRTDLKRLKRGTDSGISGVTPQRFRGRRSLAAIAISFILIIALGATIAWWKTSRDHSIAKSRSRTTVAVLPFGNVGADKDIDFLRLALPDEIATTLSRVRSFSIRPFATTSKYISPDTDLQRAGREMHVDDIVTGHFLKGGNQLQITLEAIDVDSNQTVWRDTLNVADQNMIAMREQVLTRISGGLMPALRPSAGASEPGSQPKNEEAYDVFLRSTAVPHEPSTNKEATKLLERAVGLDPTYAPAWDALGLRYYFDALYSNDGEAAFERSNAAYERAKSLDPDLISAALHLLDNRVERGELEKAYTEVEELVKRWPENGLAHFSLAYVLRYAGLLKEAQRECDTALALDPGNYEFRSCAVAFYRDGNYRRAMQYLALDMDSSYARHAEVQILLAQGKKTEALERVRSLNLRFHDLGKLDDLRMRFVEACLQQRPASEIEALAKGTETFSVSDPERPYASAQFEALCGRNEAALKLLHRAVEGGYCSYPAIDSDPLFASLRRTAEFEGIHSAAVDCQKKFLAYRNRHHK